MNQRRARVARMLGCDHNPLRRRIDRIEAAITACLLIAFVIGAPLLAIFTGRLADNAGVREQRAERSWTQVSATLLQGASAGLVGVGGDWETAWVSARWKAPSGAMRTGVVATSLNAHAGDRLKVWVTTAGQLTHEPLTSAGLRDRIGFAVTTTVIGVAALLAAVAGCVRMALQRRRLAGWERGWARIGPRWSSFR